MNYTELIKKWHVKAEQQDDYFSKYVFEYLAFIAYLRTQIFQGDGGTDRVIIQKFKIKTEYKDIYLSKIEETGELKSNWEHIGDTLNDVRLGMRTRDLLDVEETKWWNCSHDDITKKTTDEEDKLKGVIHSLEDWENMIEFWYCVRNTLFHGGKNPENPRDKFAVEYGYKTLKCLVDMFLNENISNQTP